MNRTPMNSLNVQKHKLPLLLFDLDGTLIDSQYLVFETFRRVFALRKPDYALSDEELYSFFGPTLEVTFMRYFPEEEVEEIIDLYQVINRDLHYTLLKEMPHALETIQALHTKGYEMGIVSNKRRDPVLLGMEICQLTPYFSHVFAKEDQPECKPAPGGIIHAAKTMGYEPCETVYVGDNAADMQASRRAGVFGIGYTLDTIQKEALKKEEPWHLIDDLALLPSVLLEV